MKRTVLTLAMLTSTLSVFFLAAPPSGLTLTAWRLFGLFLTTIIALILRPFPEPTIILIAIAAASVTVVPLQELLLGYVDSTLWLTVAAMIISIGLKKSGLTSRIGLWLICRFGKTSLRIGYIISFIDLLLATSTPASPARSGGIVYPLTAGIIEACQSRPAQGARRIGSYLILLLYMISMTTGSLFMTGMGPNLINVKLAQDMLGLTISWPLWSLAALPGFIAFLLLPYLLYRLYPPELHSLRGVRESAQEKLTAMGSLQRNELISGGIFLLILGLWGTSNITHINTTLVGFIGVALALLGKIVEWEDMAADAGLWSLLIWFGGILGFSSALIKSGFFIWFADILKNLLPIASLSHYTILILLALLAAFPHYLFASLGGYIAAFSSLLFSFIAVTDVPRYPAFFLVAYLMVVSSSLTHYGNVLGPMLIGQGYNDKPTWWKLGLFTTLLHLLLYLTLGLVYWQCIGLWY